MRICLVSAATATDFTELADAEKDSVRLVAEHPPLGILSLAAVAQRLGINPELVDLNRHYYQYLQSVQDRAKDNSFLEYLSPVLQNISCDFFGLSTICNSYPLTIRLARRIKELHPQSTVALGGPQATAVDLETLRAFPYIDFIVRGEAEEDPLLARLSPSRR